MAQELSFQDIKITSRDIHIRKIGVQDLWAALKAGYDDFNAKPSLWHFLFIVYPLFALIFTLVLVREELWQLAYPIVAGLALLGPVVSVVLFAMSRRRERGLELRWRLALDFVHSPTFAPIVALSVFMMVLYVLWLYTAQVLYLYLFGAESPASFQALLGELGTTRNGLGLLIYGNALGFLFAFTALASSVFAFPLLIDRPASAITAVAASIKAVSTNLLVMALWGLVVVALLALGALLFLVGLAWVLPILGHATWHLYRRVIEPEAGVEPEDAARAQLV